MSSVRRGKAMPTDGPTAKFLYTIIKQLDLKCIDWNLVASQLEISNGHAARMRYSRFRQQMEGISSTSRGPRMKKPSANKSLKGMGGPGKGDRLKELSPSPTQMVKQEPPAPTCESSSYIKSEPYGGPIPNLAEIPHITAQIASAPHGHTNHRPVNFPHMAVAPAELGRFSHAPSYPPISVPFEPRGHDSRFAWEPIKSEPHHVPEDRAAEASGELGIMREKRETSIRDG